MVLFFYAFMFMNLSMATLKKENRLWKKRVSDCRTSEARVEKFERVSN